MKYSQLLRMLALMCGCTAALGQSVDPAAKAEKAESVAKSKSQNPSDEAKAKNKKGKPKAAPPKVEQSRPQVVIHDASAMKGVVRVVEDSVDLNPTLVVWLIDRTSSARGIVSEVVKDAKAFYRSRQVAAWSSFPDKPLLTSVIAFDDKSEFLVDPPSHDGKRIESVFDEIRTSPSSREMTFTAIKQSLEKYLPIRTKEHRELVIVVVTDEAGDDGQLVEELIKPLRKQAVAVYCVGLPAPWGQSNPFAPNPKAAPAGKDDSMPTVGPETLRSERVDLTTWNNQLGGTMDVVDSGFGPYALERLCRETRGHFFALRSDSSSQNANARSWPPGTELRFDEKIVAKYAPDYVSAADYDKLIGENKARAVLVEAAKLPALKMDGQPATRFQKEAEAKMAAKMSEAQRFAARNLPPIDQLYELLIKGEADRQKLTSPRWQAEFDLAIGRVIASKARLDGYNSMIAALKRGKTFQKADSKTWVLEAADIYETESTIKKLADKAKTYLERVQQDHPGTPWATIAEEELKTPLGWTWKESP